VGDLVQQHGHVQQDREGEAGDVDQVTEPGGDVLDPRTEQKGDERSDQQPRAGDIDGGARDRADPQNARRGYVGRAHV
jgi:hypothetical protein